MTTRRDFLKKSTIASVGALLLPDTFSVYAQQNKHVGLFKLDDIKDYDYLLKNKPEHYNSLKLNVVSSVNGRSYYSNISANEQLGQILVVDYENHSVKDFRFLIDSNQLVEGTRYSANSHMSEKTTKDNITTINHNINTETSVNCYIEEWNKTKSQFHTAYDFIFNNTFYKHDK